MYWSRPKGAAPNSPIAIRSTLKGVLLRSGAEPATTLNVTAEGSPAIIPRLQSDSFPGRVSELGSLGQTVCMKPPFKKRMVVSGSFLFLYFGAYFACVTGCQWRHKNAVIPIPEYHPFDSEITRFIFAPANLVDACLFRTSLWEARIEK